MLFLKIFTLFKILWNFIYTVLLISPIALIFGGVSGVVLLVKEWLDDSMKEWNDIYRRKFISLIRQKSNLTRPGFTRFSIDEFKRYNDYPTRLEVYVKRGRNVILERKQTSILSPEYRPAPEYEVYTIDSPFIGIILSFEELVALKANVKILK